ncbi:TPA: HTH domain-containing protein [Klebsiella pneumoniae]|uniref:HTH domain-containing protein n=1 Tax=Enterobacteriaceae TaxID=543 RepID=UPI001C192A50|nr:HTH domain-containing protein [Escherichia coli]EAW0303066.1 HTH domain-containing protein [Salmonella enterica]MCP5870734.1 HTH domain-containing protein [Klebsiella pneumoniae]NBL01061.1 HTH domain-containing protein [Erysipelotrichia bacterium]HBE0550212.1 HTH domain-containing protein [Shigella sonnei]MCG6678851.1 HTH domain-containing protein [Escherichia coli]
MTALHTVKRNKTAKEMAQRLNISDRTVRKLIALPREDYEKEAKQRRLKAFVLRESGMKWADVGIALGTTKHGAIALYKRYQQIDAPTKEA